MEILLVIISLILGIFGLMLFGDWVSGKIRAHFGWTLGSVSV